MPIIPRYIKDLPLLKCVNPAASRNGNVLDPSYTFDVWGIVWHREAFNKIRDVE